MSVETLECAPEQVVTSRARELVRGIVDIMPLMLGVVPFGFVFGVTVDAAALPPIPAQATSSIMFAGASQLIFARLFGESAPWITIVLTAAILNLRHLLYSASIAPYLQGFNRRWKALLAYLLTDEAYAIVINHFGKLGVSANLVRLHKQWYFLGAGATLWLCWQASTLLGIFAGGQIPASWALDFAVPLTFIAIVVPALKDRAGIAAALVAGLVAVVGNNLPLRLSLVVATLLGIAVGYALDRTDQNEPKVSA